LAKWGAVVEILGVGYLFLLVELTLLDAGGVLKVGKLVDEGGPGIMFPFLILLLVGTGMIGIGRVRMTSIPASTGAGGVLGGAVFLTAVRFVLLGAATILFVVAIAEKRNTTGAQAVAYAFGALLASWALGTLAEFTVVPGIAAVAGAIPDRSLCWVAATTGLRFQLQGFAIIALLVIGYYTGVSEIIDRPRTPNRPLRAAFIWMAVFGIQLWFTYAQYKLYAAAAWAARYGRGDT
jgi:hypothetical protein